MEISSDIFLNQKIIPILKVHTEHINNTTNENNVNTINNENNINNEKNEKNNGTNNNKFDLIFAIGGWYDGSVCSGDVEIYDYLTDTWTACASLSVPRRLLAASSHKNNIYVFGGNCDDGVWFTAAVECYDITTNIWTRKKVRSLHLCNLL